MSSQKINHESEPPRKPVEGETSQPVYERRKKAKSPPDPRQSSLWGNSSSGKSKSNGGDKGRAADTADRSAAPRSEHRTAPEPGPPLFQSKGNCCDESGDGFGEETGRVDSAEDLGPVLERVYKIRKCSCRKWFCEGCGPRRGYELRCKLLHRLESFKDVYGVTLTVDGSLFESPEVAWQYVMQNRLLSRFVRDLNARGHLHTKAYFWVVEFQKDTEQPHWHVLLDASRIPYGELVEIWGRFRPSTAEPLAEKITAKNYKGKAPAFGMRALLALSQQGECWLLCDEVSRQVSAGWISRLGARPSWSHAPIQPQQALLSEGARP